MKHVGFDILQEEHRWWLLPLAAGHVHPTAWKFCSKLAEGKLQCVDARHKVLYLMVRMGRMALDMWRARCKDIYSYSPGSLEEAQRDTNLGVLRRDQPFVGGAGPIVPCKEDLAVDGAAESPLLSMHSDEEAREDANAPLNQWEVPLQPEFDELCGICQKRMGQVFVCHCRLRHCCGSENECQSCMARDISPDEEALAVDYLDPDASVDDRSHGDGLV